MIDYGFVNTAIADFKSKQSGDWANPSTWYAKGFDGVTWVPMDGNAGGIPDQGNAVYIEATHTITQSANQSCKDLHLNTSTDVVRLNNSTFKLFIYGKARFYSGSAPGTSDSVNAGILDWMGLGTLSFVGLTRTIIANGEFNANAGNVGTSVEIAASSGQSLQVTAVTKFGYIQITSGTLLLPTATEMRLSGAGGLTGLGTVLVKSGSNVLGGTGFRSSSTNYMASFSMEAGSQLTIQRSGYFIWAGTVSLLGTVVMDFTGSVAFPINSGISGAANIDTFSTLILQNTGAYSLQYNTTVNTVLQLISTASLVLNSKTLSYGSTANLRISTSKTSGSELPTSGSGSATPFNLIIDPGVVYTVSGTKNIRGTISLGAGASIVGTVNQNQP